MTELPRELSAADRNRDAISEVLHAFVPAEGSILEVASGAGQHAAHFASEFAPRVWQPSEYDPDRIEIMCARFAELDLPNLRDPVLLDAGSDAWPVEGNWTDPPIRMIFNVNMFQVAPWSACVGLLAGAARILSLGGVLFLYGPYSRDGVHTSTGNAEFDSSLRARNPEWGLRDLSEVCDAAEAAGLSLDRVIEMPANNLSVVFGATR